MAAPSLIHKSGHGVSWVPAYSVHTCHGLRPRGATRPGRCVSTGHGLVFRVDFHHFNSVVLSQVLISGLNPFNLSAYGLHACVLRLKYGITPVPPRISYPAAASLPGRDLHPQEYATLPSRTEIPFLSSLFPCFCNVVCFAHKQGKTITESGLSCCIYNQPIISGSFARNQVALFVGIGTLI